MQAQTKQWRAVLGICMFLLLQTPLVVAGPGVSPSSSGAGSTDSISPGYSSVNDVNYAFDSSTSTYTRLVANGEDNTGSICGSQTTMAYAEVLYTLTLDFNGNQSMNMSVYSETEFDFGSGWSTVDSLKLTANVTDIAGTWNAWTSITTNNSQNPSPSNIDLGSVTPRANGTIDVLVRLEHKGVFQSSCKAELRVYDFSSNPSEIPNITYGGPYTFTKNTPISTVNPTNTGGASTSWSITSGSLPSGLSFSTSTGAITGTPTAVYSTASITVEASNAAGSDSATFAITVQDEAPNIAYSGPYTFTKNTPISTVNPTNTGGASTSWSITSGSLPQGLSMSSTTGAITGTPTSVYSTASITVEASNAAGSDSATLSITVQDEPMQYVVVNLTTLFSSDLNWSENATAPLPESCSLSGTNLSVLSCLAGTTSEVSVWGNDSDDQAYDAVIGNMSGESPPTADRFSFVPERSRFHMEWVRPVEYYVNNSINVQGEGVFPSLISQDFVRHPNLRGIPGMFVFLSGSSLPEGMLFSEGMILGTPKEVGEFEFTVLASNEGYTQIATVLISVSENTPDFFFPTCPFTVTVGEQFSVQPVQGWHPAQTFAYGSGSSTDLPRPSWLMFDSSNGSLWGVAEEVGDYTFTVQGQNGAIHVNDTAVDACRILVEQGETETPVDVDSKPTLKQMFAAFFGLIFMLMAFVAVWKTWGGVESKYYDALKRFGFDDHDDEYTWGLLDKKPPK